MNVLVTGAKGFVGKNLVNALYNIKNNFDKRFPELVLDNIYEFDINTDYSLLDMYCSKCDFVFNLAGVNRPKNDSEYYEGNFGFASVLLETLKKNKNTSPVMLASSIQATLIGRYAESDYGKSKLAGEELFFKYSNENNAKVLVYRFPNLFGKWCKPNYNSVIATFCNNIANDLPIRVDNPNIELDLLYIDDLIEEMIYALQGKEHRCSYEGINPVENNYGEYCFVPKMYKAKLGEIVEFLKLFKEQRNTLLIPEIPNESFEKKLYSTYLSYLPKEKAAIPLEMKIDNRGSFTEIIKTINCGQFSVNISQPGVTKGEHWHNSKWELFIVVSGTGLIEQRKIDTNEVLRFYVSGKKIEAICILPGYTHNIINLSNTENLITLMWANEPFDINNPDTFYEKVSI